MVNAECSVGNAKGKIRYFIITHRNYAVTALVVL